MTRKSAFSTVVVLSGQTGSGKTTLAQALAQHINASIASFGSFVRSEAIRRDVAGDRHSLQQIGHALIDELGPVEFTKKVLNTREGGNDTITILDGVRSVEVWSAVQTIASRSILIYLDIEEYRRVDRLKKRDTLGMHSIQLIMQHQMEANIPELRAHADLILSDSSISMMLFKIMKTLTDEGVKLH